MDFILNIITILLVICNIVEEYVKFVRVILPSTKSKANQETI